MAQKISEAKAMNEYQPISGVVEKTAQLNDLKKFLDMLIPLDTQREELGRKLRGTDESWNLIKSNIVQLTKTANFRYGNYAFKATYEEAKPKTDIEKFRENLKTAFFNDISEDEFDSIFDLEAISIKLAYMYIAQQYDLDTDVVENAWDNATPKVPKGEQYRVPKMSVYKFREDKPENEDSEEFFQEQFIVTDVDVKEKSITLTKTKAPVQEPQKPTYTNSTGIRLVARPPAPKPKAINPVAKRPGSR